MSKCNDKIPTNIIVLLYVFQTKFKDISQHIHIIFQHNSNSIPTKIMKFPTDFPRIFRV